MGVRHALRGRGDVGGDEVTTPFSAKEERLPELTTELLSDVEALRGRIEAIRDKTDKSSFCGEYTDEQAQELATAGVELAECRALHHVLVRIPQLLEQAAALTRENDRLRTGMMIEGDYVMSDEPPVPPGGGTAPLQALSLEEAARVRPSFKEALELLDKQPIKLGRILMSPETARSFGMDVPEDAPVEVEEMRLGDHVAQAGRCIDVALWYPNQPNSINTIKVSLVDVRAADSILISYDKGRDVWSIKQASTFAFAADDTVCDPDWQEVAFVQAWARENANGAKLGFHLEDPEKSIDQIQEAKKLIEAEDPFCYDIASSHGQIFDNVKHMAWFINAVAEGLTNNNEKQPHQE